MLTYTDLAVTTAEALAYMASRGLTGWPYAETDQTAALRRGQDYIAREYNGKWSDEWTDAPDVVKNAIFEAALVEAGSPGVLSPMVKATDAKVLTSVGSISWTPVGGSYGADALKPRLLHVEAMLRTVTTSTRWVARA